GSATATGSRRKHHVRYRSPCTDRDCRDRISGLSGKSAQQGRRGYNCASSRCRSRRQGKDCRGCNLTVARSQQCRTRRDQEMDVQAGESKHSRGVQVHSSMTCPVCLNPETVPALTGTDFLFEATSKTF